MPVEKRPDAEPIRGYRLIERLGRALPALGAEDRPGLLPQVARDDRSARLQLQTRAARVHFCEKAQPGRGGFLKLLLVIHRIRPRIF